MRLNVYYYYLIKELTYYGIKLFGLVVRRPIAFMELEKKN